VSEQPSAEAVRAGDARAHGPGCPPDVEWTDKQLEQFKAEWQRKVRQRGEIKLLAPLPRRVRLRLAIEGAVNHVGTWLVYRGHYDAAERLWRACGMWHR
jgi:hypothetical protein